MCPQKKINNVEIAFYTHAFIIVCYTRDGTMTDEPLLVIHLKEGKTTSTAHDDNASSATTLPPENQDTKPRKEPLDFDDYLDMMWFDIWRIL
jgi:hypothetical protein